MTAAAPEPVPDTTPTTGTDAITTVADLRRIMAAFVAERQWERFHQPKNLAMSLAIEAAELMEEFQWLDVAESGAVAADPAKREAISDEMADVLAYLLSLANRLDIDLAEAFVRKMAKTRRKYPAEEFRGRWGREAPEAT
jgi:dCTP diphosphatase